MASPETARFNTSQNNKKASNNIRSNKSKSSLGSTSKTKKMVNTFFNNYGNCTNFQLCNENEEFYQNNNNNDGCAEKDYRNLLMLNTPPSKANQQSKYMLLGGAHLNHNAEASLFSCTPKDELIKTSKDDIKQITTMFNSNMKVTGLS